MSGKSSVDVRSVLELAWGRDHRHRHGPRPSLELSDIVATAVDIADSEGLERLSMQRLASRLGVTPMALYRYVGSKDDLVVLAIDAAAGDPPPRPRAGAGWRTAVTSWAGAQLDGLQRHPWVAYVPVAAPPLGPRQVAWMERFLECLDGTSLDQAERLGVLNLVAGYVLGHVRLYDELATGARAKGRRREEVERDDAITVANLIDPSRFPNVVAALSSLAGTPSRGSGEDFQFGLDCILDGVQALMDNHSHQPSTPS